MATSYVKDMMQECLSGGLDDELREMAASDAEMLGRLGVDSERERNLALYLDFFLDDLAAEMERPLPTERGPIIQAAFEQLRGKDEVDLTDIRRAVFSALGGKAKKAYHNTMGVMDSTRRPQRDISKWIRALGAVFAAQRAGETRNEAVDRMTRDWDPVEALDFRHWIRYYEKGDHEKYGLQATAAQEDQMAPAELMRGQMTSQQPEQGGPAAQQPAKRRRGRPPRTLPKTLEERKSFIVGRLDAVRRELRNFVSAWPSHVWHQLYQTLADLEQQIVSLKTESSIRDCIIRTAGVWERHGIAAGARQLRKIAQPPGNEDVVSQIEKALTGREYDTEAPAPAGAGMAGLPPPPVPEDLGTEAPAPAPPAEEPMGSPPPAAMEELPEAPPPPKAEEKKQPPSKDENPYSGSSVRDVLNVLEPLARTFKERATVRQMSKADMMMDALGIVSYFPELGEAIARVIETDSYVSTRLEKIMNKLRGGMEPGQSEEQGEEPPAIEMSPAEEAAAEVIEAPPAAAEETAAEAVETPAAGASPAAEETAAEAVEIPGA